MAVPPQFSFVLFFLLSLLLRTTVFADPLQISPSPSVSSPAPSPSSSPLDSSSAPSVDAPDFAPASSPLGLSPPAPSLDSKTPASSPSPSPSPSPSLTPSPAPEPADDGVVSHTGVSDEEGLADSSSGGMNAGKKTGVALGVIAAAGVVVMAALVYRKRQQNIRRSQYGYAARREIL
ncbi:vegetative cell wall protein gp1 [Prosopis cineraria]|uniref:vegetative cell wall protein gp1 n=1 Tax=Prosopis cineraria TaxID=364024 RepID=UPI0024100F30|nr:vegetative cell wall protein gp1 [Prosopis cineraria]